MSPRRKKIIGTMLPPKTGVRVRMYDTGFGDCFLLAFPTHNAGAFYMLIDCGVHHRFEGGAVQMQKVARDIAAATGGRLDIVVVTHEHTDHTWGFRHAREIFKGIKIEKLWLAWTEDPDDKLAQLLKQQFGMQMDGLKAAIDKLGKTQPGFSRQLQALFEFEPAAAEATTGNGDVSELEFLRAQSVKKLTSTRDYRQPAEPPLALTGVGGARVFVMGPPRDKDLIKVLDRSSELYPENTAMDETTAFAMAALAGDGSSGSDEQPWVSRNRPFESNRGMAPADAQNHPDYKEFFQSHYGFSGEEGHSVSWRRIDDDWLYASEQLALSINAKTNNTSLVLAIELDGGEVLLFAADAQVGNWLSWQKLEWPGLAAGGLPLKGADILARTVLYKAGHHGSRNATLSRQGLEQMTNPDLVAMISVNEKWAREEMHWEHPAPVLLSALQEKTRGRIIRMDEIPADEHPLPVPANTPPEVWKEFTDRMTWDPSGQRLWVEYRLGKIA